jgi:hypothetical protein
MAVKEQTYRGGIHMRLDGHEQSRAVLARHRLVNVLPSNMQLPPLACGHCNSSQVEPAGEDIGEPWGPPMLTCMSCGRDTVEADAHRTRQERIRDLLADVITQQEEDRA